MHRRTLIKNAMAGSLAIALPQFPYAFGDDQVKPEIEKNIAWYNVEDWGVEGKGWNDTLRFFDRLPARAEKKVRAAVWGLSRHSAGMMARFRTNSQLIQVRYKLMSPRVAMSHMPATGVSGVDLYGTDPQGRMRWINVSRPAGQQVNAVLASGIDRLPENKPREYELYLPLYNGVETLEIGVQPESQFQTIRPRTAGRIVFYGTSIMHGACASRPGMSITGILQRKLKQPVINLGFSGNGKMETEVIEFINELNPGILVVDCLPNMNAELVRARTEPLVHQVRKAHPRLPVVLVEDRSFTNSPFFKSRREHHAASRKELRQAYERLTRTGVADLHYLPGDRLLGTDGEGATDGSHPNDLGMMRYADSYETVLRPLVDKAE